MMDRGRVAKFVTCLMLVMGVGSGAAAWYVGGQLVNPARRSVGELPSDLPGTSVRLVTGSGLKIKCWHLTRRQAVATVILLHPIRGDRRSMLKHARMFRAAGYATLLIDLPSHGESDGDAITAGWRESEAVTVAVEFVRRESPDHMVGIVGRSLGGAAALFASPLGVDALVLESVYPTVNEAVHNRVAMRLGPLHHILAPALTWQLYPRLGVSASSICPIDYISRVDCPVLILSGDQDRHTTLDETRRLYDAAVPPRRLCVFEGAKHIDLLSYDAELYETQVLLFLEQHLN